MQEEKRGIYTVILGVCMLLCLLLIGRMLLGAPPERQDGTQSAPEQQEGEQQVGIQVDEQTLTALIEQALPFAPQSLSVHIGADGTVSLQAAVDRQALEDSGLVPGSMRTALLFLPARCEVSAAWAVSVQDGAVALQCRQAALAGAALPQQAAAALDGTLSDAVNRALAARQLAPSALQWADGCVTILQ